MAVQFGIEGLGLWLHGLQCRAYVRERDKSKMCGDKDPMNVAIV